MPIDLENALGASLPALDYSWSEEDVILYHLGVGAGDPPIDEKELRYTYEGDLHVLPTFGTIPPFGVMMSMGAVPGLDITIDQILHGEQEIILHQPIPTEGSVSQHGRITDIFDKGSGALIVMEILSRDSTTGELLFTNRPSIFLRREGGFGGNSGPEKPYDAPERDPDHVVESPTLPQLALLYRMSSGDKNPLHADPGFASFAGFERPILHGLCTYGVVAKAVVDSALSGPEEVGSYRARFSGVVYPGETIVTRIWDMEDHLVVSAETKERGKPVISNAGIVRR